jgi:ferritin-like metal-binding protein YciE
MKIESLQDLLLDQIKDLYDAEQRLVKALPDMAEAASSPELRRAIQSHLQETKAQVNRLERIFTYMGEDAKSQSCAAMKGLIEEGQGIVSHTEESPLRDAGIIAAANRVEHYEMAAYGAARTFAETLGMDRVATLLQETLEEEKRADAALTRLAQADINDRAPQLSQSAK